MCECDKVFELIKRILDNAEEEGYNDEWDESHKRAVAMDEIQEALGKVGWA